MVFTIKLKMLDLFGKEKTKENFFHEHSYFSWLEKFHKILNMIGFIDFIIKSLQYKAWPQLIKP